jgi:hypothetical protein
MTDDLPESEESLFTLAAPPLVWAAHFLVSYATAAIYCAKLAGPDGSLAPARIAIGVYTAVALAAVAFLGLRGYRRHRAGGGAPPPHDDDSPIGRHRFLGFATVLLAGLSALAIVYAALVAVFVRSCR